MSTNATILLMFFDDFSCCARDRQAVGLRQHLLFVDHFERSGESTPPRFGTSDFHGLLVITSLLASGRGECPEWDTSYRAEGAHAGREGAFSAIL